MSGIVATVQGLRAGESPYVLVKVSLDGKDENAQRILAVVFGADMPPEFVVTATTKHEKP